MDGFNQKKRNLETKLLKVRHMSRLKFFYLGPTVSESVIQTCIVFKARKGRFQTCVHYNISQLPSEHFLETEAITRIFLNMVCIIKVENYSCKVMILLAFAKWSFVSRVPWSAKMFLSHVNKDFINH